MFEIIEKIPAVDKEGRAIAQNKSRYVLTMDDLAPAASAELKVKAGSNESVPAGARFVTITNHSGTARVGKYELRSCETLTLTAPPGTYLPSLDVEGGLFQWIGGW